MTSPPGEVVAADLYVGSTEDPNRYLLQERRSAGGEGEVWRAVAHHAGETFQYAVKALHVDISDTAALENLRLQAALLTQLEHQALVKVHEVFVGPASHTPDRPTGTPDRLYLVMKWIHGRSLEEALNAGSLSPRAALDALTQVCDAVDYLHSGADTGGRAVLHRDIKPANILLTDTGRAYLVDFGLARLSGAELMSRVAGTLPLMAPESVRLGRYSPATDRYGLGATLYSVLVGEPPMPGAIDLMTDRLHAHLDADHAAMAPLILAMLDVDPDRRPASARSWLAELKAVAAGGPQPALVTARPSRSSSWLTAALAGLTVAGLGGGYAAHRWIQPDAPVTPSAVVVSASAGPAPGRTTKAAAEIRPTTEPTRATVTTAPTTDRQRAALKQLDEMSAHDLAAIREQISPRGQYVAQLAAKYVDISDAQQPKADGSIVYHAADILAEHQRLRESPGDESVVLLKSTTYGQRKLFKGKPLYQTFALGDFADRQSVRAWCQRRYPELDGEQLANRCTSFRLQI